MEIVKVQQAKTHLSSLLSAVEQGETFIIARGDKPVAHLTPIEYDGRRPLGFVPYPISDSFSDPLPEEELGTWEGTHGLPA